MFQFDNILTKCSLQLIFLRVRVHVSRVVVVCLAKDHVDFDGTRKHLDINRRTLKFITLLSICEWLQPHYSRSLARAQKQIEP